MSAQERAQERNCEFRRRAIAVALLAATAAKSANRECNYIDGVSSSPECWDYCRGKDASKIVAVEFRPSDGLCCCETECPCLADADGPFELTTVGSILELDECPGDESADDIPMNAADE